MRRQMEEAGMNMTPMIDVVFQLIIFFVTTADLQNKSLDTKVRLAMAPHGPAVEKKDPREIVVDVDGDSHISIARTQMSVGTLKSILRKTVREQGQTIPVVIRGDGKANHEAIKAVMDACAAAGLWKVKFAALKEKS
jgi:biopolymer transport protein ExbD